MALPNLDELGVQFTNNPDGTAEIKLPTGEVFKGNKDEVIANLAKSKIETRRYADDYKTKYETVQHELDSRQPPPPPPTTGLDPETKKLGDYLWDTLAKSQFGPNASGQQLVQALNQQQAAVQKLNEQSAISDFQMKCPDFPNTDAASDAVIERAMRDFNVTDFDQLSQYQPQLATNYMIAAHRACVAEGTYQPLSREQQLASSDAAALEAQRGGRPSPPPMVPGSGNPEIHDQGQNEWSISLADLRARAIKAQLEGK